MNRKYAILLLMLGQAVSSASADTLTREQILTNADRLADAQLKIVGDKAPIDWVAGTFYAGLADYLRVSPNAAEYRKAVDTLGRHVQWSPALYKAAPLHADTFCIAMAFEEASVDQHDPAILGPLKVRLDALADHLAITTPDAKLTWSWCDALFMAPRGMARMSSLSGDRKYLDAMDKEWWRTTDLLYDPREHLFFRDKSYFPKKTKDGRKVFWARGNGWVIAGLARVLSFMPADYPTRPKYVQLFKELAARLVGLQTPDGTWHPSLLAPDDFDTPETSGTSLNCYALAWGINNGLLAKNTYLPVVLKAWTAMTTAERPDGLPGYVQSEGASPAKVKPSNTRLYASGSYLLSALELTKLAPVELSASDLPSIKIQPPPMPAILPTTKP